MLKYDVDYMDCLCVLNGLSKDNFKMLNLIYIVVLVVGVCVFLVLVIFVMYLLCRCIDYYERYNYF